MFPTEELIAEIKATKEKLLVERDFTKDADKLERIIDIMDNLCNSLLKYYEWKKKPFMGEK